jgi:hypothetical protein
MRFETINGTLCVMTEPRPLVPSIEYPYVISGIKTKHPSIVTKDMDALLRIFIIAYSDEFEVIGYPVEEGSAEWALYQMMQGKMVCHKTSRWDWYRMYNDHAIQNRTAGCMPRVSAWLESTVQSGWQIYEEPKPTFKVGDWVDCKDPVGIPTQCKVLEILEHNVIVECKTGHRWSLPHNNITRKLSPSEIIVNIGCMSGTVKDLSYVEDGIFWFIGKKTERCPGVMHAILYGEMLDTETRELVEGLLKAQKEEEQDEKIQ